MTHQNFDQMRHAMVVSQLRTTAVSDPVVVDAMARVPREQFVPESRRNTAYADMAIPFDVAGRALNPAMATGRLLTALQLEQGDTLLLIGAATGYAAAVAAAMGCTVVAVESDETLAAQAKANLKNNSSVTVVKGAMQAGAARHAPYDKILIDGAIDALPASLVKQLKDGGRIAYAVHDKSVTRLCAGVKVDDTVSAQSFLDAAAVNLPDFTMPAVFEF